MSCSLVRDSELSLTLTVQLIDIVITKYGNQGMKSGFYERFSAEMVTAYGETSAALARGRERMSRFPEPGVLSGRVILAQQEALAWLEGESFIPDQLALDYGTSPRAWRRWPFTFVRVFDRKIPGRGRMTSANIFAWINRRARTKEPSPAPADEPIALDPDRLQRFIRLIGETAPLPDLIAGADLAAGFTRISPLPHGNIVIGTMFAEQLGIGVGGLSAGGIAAIGLKSRQTPWTALLRGGADQEADDLSEAGDTARLRLAWLAALQAGAIHVVALSDHAHFWLIRLNELCAQGRKTSHMRDV